MAARTQEFSPAMIASVLLRVKITSRGLAAWMKRANRRRASSNSAVASSAMAYTPRWMFALQVR